MVRIPVSALLGAGLAMIVMAAPASADHKRTKRAPVPTAERDCTPINGRYGYYGNPWCDTGSYRMEDIQFREREAAAQRWREQQKR